MKENNIDIKIALKNANKIMKEKRPSQNFNWGNFIGNFSSKEKKIEKISYIDDKIVNRYNFLVRRHIEELKRQQIDFWRSLNGWQFEHEVAKVFQKRGFTVNVTKGSGDRGIDLEISNNNKRIIVQCKSHGKKIGPLTIRDLYGTLIDSGADIAILVSFSGFSSGVYNFIGNKPIKLMTIDDILKLNT